MLYLAIMFHVADVARGRPVPEGKEAGILRLMEVSRSTQPLSPLEEVVRNAKSRILKASEREILVVASFLPADISLNTGAEPPPLGIPVRFVYHIYQNGGSSRFDQLLKHIQERPERSPPTPSDSSTK